MLKRDIDISQHIADCKARYYHPFAVIFAAAKNSPDRVSEITRIFTEAGLVNTHPISMQYHAFTQFCEQSIADNRYYDFTNYPAIYHLVLHSERDSLNDLLGDFVSSQPWWRGDEYARTAFEIDLLRKPFLYRNTDVTKPRFPFEQLGDIEVLRRGYTVTIPPAGVKLLERYIKGAAAAISPGEASTVLIDHEKIQFPYNPQKSEEDRADYCNGMITRVAGILPSWSAAAHVNCA